MGPHSAVTCGVQNPNPSPVFSPHKDPEMRNLGVSFFKPKNLLIKQSHFRWFETPCRTCDVTVMVGLSTHIFFQIGGIEITAARNKYGRQYESFETELELHDSSLIGTGKHAPSDELVNSLGRGRFEWNFRQVICKLCPINDAWCFSYEIDLRWMSLDLADD